MKNKIFTLLGLSILSLVMLMSFASAVTHVETFDNSTATGSYGDDSFLGEDGVTWTYTDARDEGSYEINGVGMIFRDTNGKIISNTISGGIGDFSVDLKKASATAGDRQVELFINSDSQGTYDLIDDFNTFTVNNINIEGNIIIEIRNTADLHVAIDNIEWTEYTAPVEPEEITDCATTGVHGDLKLKIDDITVKEGFGDDDDYWYLFDEIEVDIEVENDGDDDIDDIEIAWGLYDKNSEEFLIDEEENDFNLKDGDDKTITIKFKLDDDIEDYEDADLVFYAWANGEVDDDDNTKTCASDSHPIEVITDDAFVLLYDFKVNGLDLEDLELTESVQCGEELHFTVEVWNVGDDEQDDVEVEVYNKELGIAERIEIGDIDGFEDEVLDFTVAIPTNAEEGPYTIKFWVYDDDSDIYETDEEEDESEFNVLINVQGGCSLEEQLGVLVSAELVSGGEAGEELVVKATVTNTGDELATFELALSDYSSWADSAELDQTTLVLGEGEAQEVMITFMVGEDASGEQSFDIEVMSEATLLITQSVSIELEAQKGFGMTGFSVKETFGENWYLWLIGALNVILVLIIIIVAVKVARS